MKTLGRCIVVCLLCVSILLIGTLSASAEGVSSSSRSQAEDIVADILRERLSVSQADDVQTAIRDTLPTMGDTGIWYAITLSQLGSYDFSSYEAWLLGQSPLTEATGAVDRQKYALTLAAIGSTDAYIRTALSDTVGAGGIMSLVFGLHLLQNGYTCADRTVSDVCERLIERTCEGGGWSLSGQTADVDVTAMVLCALAPLYETSTAVREAADDALSVLSEVQLPDADFSAYGASNAESTAQVLLALSSLGIDAATDTRFIKNGHTLFDALALYRTPTGTFAHARGGEENAMATVQALYACVGYLRMQNGQAPLFILDGCDAAHAAPPLASTDTPPTDGASPSWVQDYRVWVVLALVLVAALACLLLALTGRRSARHYIGLWLIVGVLIGVVCLTDIRSPDDYYTPPEIKDEAIGTVTVTVRYDAVAGRQPYLREDGILIPEMTLSIADGDTVYDLLCEATRACGVPLYTSGHGIYTYVRGIGSLFAYDFGDLSGWVYSVNGVSPSVGCDTYALTDGDVIEWQYSLSLGQNI